MVDTGGRELAGTDEAEESAKVLALQLLQGADSDPELLRAVLFVEDAAQEVVLELPLTEALAAELIPTSAPRTVH